MFRRRVRLPRTDHPVVARGLRADLPGARFGDLRSAAAAADGGRQPVALRHRVHGLDRRQQGRHDRDLVEGSGPHGPGRGRSEVAAGRADPPRSHLPAARARGRRAGSRRSHRGDRRSVSAGRPAAGRSHLRGHQAGWRDGAVARTERVLPPARVPDRLHRRPGRVSSAPRAPDRTRRDRPDADPLRRLRLPHLPQSDRRPDPHGADGRYPAPGRGRAVPADRRRGAGAGAFAVPDRRRVRLAALRLRAAAAAGDAAGAGGRAGHRALHQPGGPWHRPRQQAARLRAAGPRHGYRRGERAPRLPRRRARVRHRRPDPARPRSAAAAAAQQQPEEAGRPAGLRARDRRAGAAHRRS